ncbi:hypothetical protein M9434_007192 [Picochlorum sp. BPE23]|nr:hypothetical protein M9434_007192 [Picochlorum sp. BPE23]
MDRQKSEGIYSGDQQVHDAAAIYIGTIGIERDTDALTFIGNRLWCRWPQDHQHLAYSPQKIVLLTDITRLSRLQYCAIDTNQREAGIAFVVTAI